MHRAAARGRDKALKLLISKKVKVTEAKKWIHIVSRMERKTFIGSRVVRMYVDEERNRSCCNSVIIMYNVGSFATN